MAMLNNQRVTNQLWEFIPQIKRFFFGVQQSEKMFSQNQQT